MVYEQEILRYYTELFQLKYKTDLQDRRQHHQLAVMAYIQGLKSTEIRTMERGSYEVI